MLTTADVAHQLGMSKVAIQKAADEGRLPCQRGADGSRVFDESEVARFDNQRRAGRRRGQPTRPKSGANRSAHLGPTWGPTTGPTLPLPPAAQVGHPHAGANSVVEVDPSTEVAGLVGANLPQPTDAANYAWTPDRFARAYALLDHARRDPRGAFGSLVALWPATLTPDEVAALGDKAKLRGCASDDDLTRARSALECLTCLGFSGRPMWAAHIRDLPDRIEIDPALFWAPAGKMVVPCDRCPGPAIALADMPADACPLCSGIGIAPYWAHNVFLTGVDNRELAEPWAWGPSACRLCLGWGRMAPMLAPKTETRSSS